MSPAVPILVVREGYRRFRGKPGHINTGDVYARRVREAGVAWFSGVRLPYSDTRLVDYWLLEDNTLITEHPPPLHSSAFDDDGRLMVSPFIRFSEPWQGPKLEVEGKVPTKGLRTTIGLMMKDPSLLPHPEGGRRLTLSASYYKVHRLRNRGFAFPWLLNSSR